MTEFHKRTILQAAAVLVIVLAILLIPSERRRIRRQFKRLAGYAEKEQAESVFKGARKSSAISELVTDPCEIRGSIHYLGGTYSRREAAQVVAAARTEFNTLTLSFHDMNIDFPGKTTALVTVTARLNSSVGGERITDMRTLECRMVKVGKQWLFNQCRSINSWRE